jgi:hypothetical protein
MDTLYLYNVVQHASHTPVDVYIHIIHMTPLWSAAKGWLLALILALILKDIIANSYNLLCSLMAWSVCLKCSLFRWTVSARSNYLRQHCQARVEISSWWTIYLWIVYIYINTDIIIYIYMYVYIYACICCESSTVCAHTYIQVFPSTARETIAFIPSPGLRGGLRPGMSLLEVAAKEAFWCRWLLGVWKRGCFNNMYVYI